MNPLTPPLALTGAQLRTYEDIFAFPSTHQLNWPEVFAMFSQLGDVSVEANGHLKIVHHGYTMILPTPTTREITSFEDLMKLRRFLKKSEPPPTSAELAAAQEQEDSLLTREQRDAKNRL